MTVRTATVRDESQLMSLCRALHQDNGIFTMDDDLVYRMLHSILQPEQDKVGGGVIGVIDGDDELAAAICIMFSHFWYSHDVHLEELFNFVRPEYRRTTYGREMLEFAKRCQQTLGLPLFTGIVTNKRLEAKVTMYRKKLGPPAGAFFVVGATWQNEETRPCDDLWVNRHADRGSKQVESILPARMTTMTLPMMPIASAK